MLATDASPWLHLEPNSLQRSPIYLGSTPRELALGLAPVDGGVAKLPATLKALGELQLKGIYLAVPGAADNASATAALLRAAEVLRTRQPERSIWLVHFTGEEFPADDLGARALVSQMLGDRQDIAGLVLLDMIGSAGTGQTQFQINPGPHAASLQMAAVVLDAQADVSPQLTPLLEPRYSERSYLYNTDGIILSENGYPVVLINEHINYFMRLMRAAYHDMGDTSDKVNFPFAVALTKVAIETTARLSGVN